MSDIPLGFEHQGEYENSCGAFALGHALNLVGITGEIENFKNSSNYISWSRSTEKNFRLSGLFKRKTYQKIYDGVGTGERGILSGIKKNGCNPIPIDNYSKQTSRKILDTHLKKGCSVILHASRLTGGKISSHWNVCAGKSGNKYIFIDSYPLLANKKVISLYSWEEIVKRSIQYEKEGNYFQLFGFAVQPPDCVSAVPRLHKYLTQLFRDESLREWWGYYLEDLREIFDTVGTTKNVITASEFFSKYGPSFLENARYWNSNISKGRIEKELANYQLVADTYNFAVSKSNLDEALIGFTSALITACQVE